MRTMRTLSLAMLVATTLATPALAGPLAEPDPGDLTGTWSGLMKCKWFNGEVVTTDTLNGHLAIDQTGPTLALDTNLSSGTPAVVVKGDPGIIASMCGVVFPKNDEKPETGVGAIAPVGANGVVSLGVLAEFQAVALKTKTFATNTNGESGKLTGKGTMFPGLVIGSCRWKFSRIDTVRPFMDRTFCDGEKH